MYNKILFKKAITTDMQNKKTMGDIIFEEYIKANNEETNTINAIQEEITRAKTSANFKITRYRSMLEELKLSTPIASHTCVNKYITETGRLLFVNRFNCLPTMDCLRKLKLRYLDLDKAVSGSCMDNPKVLFDANQTLMALKVEFQSKLKQKMVEAKDCIRNGTRSASKALRNIFKQLKQCHCNM